MSLNNFNTILKNYFYQAYLSDKEYVKAHLMLQYQDKLSHRQAEYDELMEKGKKRMQEELERRTPQLTTKVKKDSFYEAVIIGNSDGSVSFGSHPIDNSDDSI